MGDGLLIENQRDLNRLVDKLLREPEIGVDTEEDSLYSYYYKVCLIQVSTREEDFLIDTISIKDLSPLGLVMASPDVQKIFHAAVNDILSMKRDFDFDFTNIFDTQIAARLIGWEYTSLSFLLEQKFGVVLNKKFQKANWGKRPLSPELIEYARMDTHYLIPLKERLERDLKRSRMYNAARKEFRKLESIEPGKRRFDPYGYWKIKGAKSLTRRQRRLLEMLYNFREREARRLDRPPFKVLSNEGMINICKALPSTLEELRELPGVGDWHVRKFGKALLKMVSTVVEERSLR